MGILSGKFFVGARAPSPALRHLNGGKGWGEGLSESFS